MGDNETDQIDFNQSDDAIFQGIVTQILNKIYKHINLLPVLLRSLRRTPFSEEKANRLYKSLLSYCQSGLEANSADAFYIAGFLCIKGFEESNPPLKLSLAASYLDKAIEQNHAYALHSRGYMYYYGIGGPKNITEAIVYYKKAIEKDCGFSMNNLALIYLAGEAGVMDVTVPLQLLERASKQGHSSAMHNLADFYNRIGWLSKQEEAKRLENRAIDLLETNAIHKKARLSFNSRERYSKEAANLLYRRAAQLGHVVSMYNYSVMLHKENYRLGVGRTVLKVIELLDSAIEQGSSYAMAYRGHLYEISYGTEIPDTVAANRLYEKAIAMGNYLAMHFQAKSLTDKNIEHYRAARLARKAYNAKSEINFDYFLKSKIPVYQYHAAMCKMDFRTALSIVKSCPGLWSEFFQLDLITPCSDYEHLKLRCYCIAEKLKSLVKIETFTDVFKPDFKLGELELKGIIDCLKHEDSFIAQLVCAMLLDGRILNEVEENKMSLTKLENKRILEELENKRVLGEIDNKRFLDELEKIKDLDKKENIRILDEHLEIRMQDAVRFYFKALDKVRGKEKESEFVKNILWEMKESCGYPSVQTFLQSLDILPEYLKAGSKKFNCELSPPILRLSIFAFTPAVAPNGQESIVMMRGS